MTPIRSYILLPSHGLADLPEQLAADDADEMLAMWTAAWHPRLIAAAGQLPEWNSADSPSATDQPAIIFLPRAARAWLAGEESQLDGDQRLVVTRAEDRRGHDLRDVLAQRATEWLAVAGGGAPATPPLSADLVADFYAFGYWYLQTELLSYPLRYTSGLDRDVVGEKLVAAASAAVQGDDAEAGRQLPAAFGLLADACAHYYPVSSFVIDLVLVAKFNCDAGLAAELVSGQPRNVWLTGETLEHMARHAPSSLQRLAAAVSDGQVEVLGGQWNELPVSLVSRSQLMANLRRGRAAFQEHLSVVPRVYMRRRFGLGPVSPAALHHAHFLGAVQTTFDGGREPTNLPARGEWEGPDGSVVEALGQTALDASLPETALGLGVRLGASMESDFVATLVLARWAGQRTVWLEDFDRGRRFM